MYGATGQRRFHDVGGIHAARRASCADDGVYLVDENDDVGVVLYFFEQAANTFFKLSAILRSGHHTRHIQAHYALIKEHGRRFALGNELSQPLDDGTFAHTRFANDDGIVLFTATENFGNAQNFLLPTHHGVEFILHCGLGKVGRKAVEDGCFAVSLSRLRSLRTFVALCAAAARHGFVFLVVGKSEAILRWHGPLLQVSQGVFVVQVVAFEHLFGGIVHAVVQHSQQKVLHIHGLRVLYACLQHGQFQDVVCHFVKGHLVVGHGYMLCMRLSQLFQLQAHGFDVGVLPFEEFVYRAATSS